MNKCHNETTEAKKITANMGHTLLTKMIRIAEWTLNPSSNTYQLSNPWEVTPL